jgi:hypothetical protein
MARNIGHQALADFFASMATQKAHWYSLTNSSPSDAPHTMIDSIFPKLSTLLSVEPKIMDSMLQLCGLSQERRGRMTPVLGTWTDFISEARVDIEITTFAIEKKRLHFIRIGLWNKATHPAKLPLTCWRERLAAPKLWISVLTKTFAESVGPMNVGVVADESDKDYNVSDSDSSDGDSDLIGESHGVGKDDAKFLSPSVDLPQNGFPMLHSLGIM